MPPLVAISKNVPYSRISQVWFVCFLMGRFTTTNPEMKFHFVSPVMTSNLNKILVKRNFVSGIFHLGSQNNISDISRQGRGIIAIKNND